jgi:alpha-ketoglutarate-dependent taurine dioxygenase
MHVLSSDATLGAYLHGVDLRSLDDGSFTEIEQLWRERAVLVCPEQHLDDESQIAFSRRLGRLERLEMTSIEAERPEIYGSSNRDQTDHLESSDGAHALRAGPRCLED